LSNSTHRIYRSAAGQAAFAELRARQLAAWPIDYAEQTLETRAGTTHLLMAGDPTAPPLLLFHDWGESAANLPLHYDLEWLAVRYHLLMPDTPGQPGGSAGIPPDDYGTWAVALLDALGVWEAFAMGSAGGGKLALKLAAAAPDRVIRAVVVESGGLVSLRQTAARTLTSSLPLRWLPSVGAAQRWVKAVSAAGRANTAAHGLLARQVAMVAQHVSPFAVPVLTDAELAVIRAPVLLLYGEQNPLLRAQSVRRAESRILNAQVEPIPTAGQFAGLDAPGVVETRMQAFFAALG
jgi:pimeloyl-ACP methyl ester carboxylesterase